MKLIFEKYRTILFGLLAKGISYLLWVEIPPVVAAGALIEQNGKLLVLNYSYLDGYGVPGGIVKAGENLEEALVREVKEETNLQVTSCEYFCSSTNHKYGLSNVNTFFLVSTEGQPQDSNEGALRWIEPEELIGACAYPGVEVAVRKLIEQRIRS